MPLPVLKNLNSNAAAAVTPKVTIWNGDAGDGSYTNNDNYTNDAPAEGSTVYVVNSSEDITTNLNQSSVSLKEYRIGPTYRGSVGTPKAPLKIQAERLVIDTKAAQVNIQGPFREIHIRRGSGRIKVGGGTANKLEQVVVHGYTNQIDISTGQCNKLIVGRGQSNIVAATGITNDNPLAQVAGFDEIRCGSGSKVLTSSGVNELYADGKVEIDTGNIFNAQLTEDGTLTTKTTGRIDGRLTMYGGVLDIRNPDTGDTFTIDAADLYGGEINTRHGDQRPTFSANASILGTVIFNLRNGTEVDIA
tara:strand:- start:386 stop:1297 length:912 start_codon:yes stop_codon:yes gene_type:complete